MALSTKTPVWISCGEMQPVSYERDQTDQWDSLPHHVRCNHRRPRLEGSEALRGLRWKPNRYGSQRAQAGQDAREGEVHGQCPPSL